MLFRQPAPFPLRGHRSVRRLHALRRIRLCSKLVTTSLSTYRIANGAQLALGIVQRRSELVALRTQPDYPRRNGVEHFQFCDVHTPFTIGALKK
jgi:hypothetical protein